MGVRDLRRFLSRDLLLDLRDESPDKWRLRRLSLDLDLSLSRSLDCSVDLDLSRDLLCDLDPLSRDRDRLRLLGDLPRKLSLSGWRGAAR